MAFGDITNVIVAFGLGSVATFAYDYFRSPKLEIALSLHGPYVIALEGPGGRNYIDVYRISVANQAKWALSTAAENCRATMYFCDESGLEKSNSLCWADGNQSTTLNVADHGQIEVCGLYRDRQPEIVLPANCSGPAQVPMRTGLKKMDVRLEVTCANGKKAAMESHIYIKDGDQIVIQPGLT